MEKITETEIAGAFFGSIIKNVDEAWPEIYKQLKDMFGKEREFKIENEDDAKMNLALAAIGLEMQALKNLFPDRAERIYAKALNSTGSLEDREYLKRKIDLYQDKFRESTEQYARNKYYSPFEEVAVQLIRDWFGDNVSKFYVRNTQVVNPLLAGVLSHILMLFVGFWKKVKANFEIIED